MEFQLKLENHLGQIGLWKDNSKPSSMVDKALINGKWFWFGSQKVHRCKKALIVEAKSQTTTDILSVPHKARDAFIYAKQTAWNLHWALSHNTPTSEDIKCITRDQIYHKCQDGSACHGTGNILGQDEQQILIRHRSYYVRVNPCRVKLVKSDSTKEQCIQRIIVLNLIYFKFKKC